jgi:hypothetical protein
VTAAEAVVDMRGREYETRSISGTVE